MAVRALQKGEESGADLDRTLASHLMQYYAHGSIELDDPLLAQFFESASVKLRDQALVISAGVWHKSQPFITEIQTRFMRLWESRMSLLNAGSKDDANRTCDFGWWMSSGKFPEEWAIRQAMPILGFLDTSSRFRRCRSAKPALNSKYQYEAVRVVHVLFEDDQDGWAIHGWNQHLDNILKRALNDGDLARKEAEE